VTTKSRPKSPLTKTASSRLEIGVLTAASTAAKETGMSLGAFMREAVLEKLARLQGREEALSDLHKEVRKLRAELALATEAIMTVSGGGKAAQPAAAAWVKNNLNR
jgi:hypothetical protein